MESSAEAEKRSSVSGRYPASAWRSERKIATHILKSYIRIVKSGPNWDFWNLRILFAIFLIITIRNTAGRSGVRVKLWIRLHPDPYQFFPRIRIFNLWHPDVELSVFELSFSLALVRMLKVIRSRSPKTNHTAICGRSGPLQLEPLILFVKKSNAALSWLITFFTVLFTFRSILFCRCLRIRVLSPRIEFVRQD